MLRSNSCRSRLVSFNSSAIASAISPSSVTSSSTARVACVTRPAALRRGAKVKPICPDVIVRSCRPATSLSFLMPKLGSQFIFSRPAFTMMRFSPTKGTTSATVPKATISRSSKYHSPYFVSHNAWHNLKATPTPDKFLSL